MITYTARNIASHMTSRARIRPLLLLVALAAIILCNSACSRVKSPAVNSNPTRDAIKTALEPNAVETPDSSVDVPAEIDRALLPPLSPQEQTEPRRFDIGAEGVDARAFFAGLAAETHTNVVVHPAISGSISLNLRDVTLEETLNIVREVYG
ncbi:MAG: hypothetical protein R6V18_09860, partial [Desulfuromonadaceae bacterium]